MTDPPTTPREGSLDAPTRHPLEWKTPAFWDQAALDAELDASSISATVVAIA